MSLFQEISYGSKRYEAECVLRDEVLRQPLGLSLWDEELSLEKNQWHFGCFSEERGLEACAVVEPLDEHHAKVRQVAVKSHRQRCGLGLKLMGEIERVLRERGFTQISLHSREPVVGFYLALEYQVEGEEFEEVGLSHRKMVKAIGSRV